MLLPSPLKVFQFFFYLKRFIVKLSNIAYVLFEYIAPSIGYENPCQGKCNLNDMGASRNEYTSYDTVTFSPVSTNHGLLNHPSQPIKS